MKPSTSRIAHRYLSAYSYNDEVGGTLSWEVHLGGDAGNWRVVGAEDGRSWQDILRQLVKAFKGIRTRHGGAVEGVQVGRGSNTLRVYFDYDEAIDTDDALYDAEDALEREIKTLSDRDQGFEWVLHGSVHGLQRSNLEIKGEAIEAGFDSRRASRKTAAELGPMPRRKVVQMVNAVIDRAPLKGMHRDEYWRPVQALWKAFDKAGIPWSISKSEYQYESMGGERVPARKVWRFEIPFTSDRGRPGIVYGQVVAAGAGSVEDPLSVYDVTAYVS